MSDPNRAQAFRHETGVNSRNEKKKKSLITEQGSHWWYVFYKKYIKAETLQSHLKSNILKPSLENSTCPGWNVLILKVNILAF
jgi:hypothetical protein